MAFFKKKHEKHTENLGKHLSNLLFQDRYRISTARSQNFSLILFKLTDSLLKKNKGTAFFWQTS